MNTRKVNVQMLEPQPTNGIRTIDTTSSQTIAKPNVSGSLHHPIKFGRWLLKYAKEGWDEGLLCWQYNDKYFNTDELYEVFCSQQ